MPRPPAGTERAGADRLINRRLWLPRPVPTPRTDPSIRRWLFITACIATPMLLWQFLPAIEA